MEKKYLKKILIFEILIVAAVPFIFKMIEPKKVAALFAGSLFVTLGVCVIYGSLKYSTLRKTFYTAVGGIHLFVVSIPMLAARIFFFDTDFNQIQILGMGAPDFHKYSEWVYMALLFATMYELGRRIGPWAKKETKKAT